MAVKLKAAALGGYDVLVEGEHVGRVYKRTESYSGLRSGNGRGGGTFTYWDAESTDRRRVVQYVWTCGKCGGETLHETCEGGFQRPVCQSCGYDHPYPKGTGYTAEQPGPVRVDGARFTDQRGRDNRLGASTRKDAVAALIAAAAREQAGEVA